MAEVAIPNVRFVEINFGDSLRSIALRELGDAARWTELAQVNELRPPYISDQTGPGILSFGDKIMVPAATVVPADTDPNSLYGIDVRVTDRSLMVADGDFAIVSGIPNLAQALTHHVMVEKRELAFHPQFGSYVRSLLGRGNGPTAGLLAAFYVKSALIEDKRVAEVTECSADATGDQIAVRAVVVPVTSKPMELRILV